MSHLRRNLMLAAGACLAANLALAGWLLSPAAPSQAATQQQLRLARAQLAGLRTQRAQLRRFGQRLHTTRQQMQELMAAGIPDQADASSKLLQEFSRIAGLSQVQVSGAEFHPDKKAQLGLRRVAISMQVAGGYTGVVRFLNQMERSPMFFLINQVSVSGGGAAGAASSSQVRLQVQLEAYVQVAEQGQP
ncbi:MAG TPA: type 4a pilus biogenesis protein PilO [Terriglobales bacterium]|nr:type 4a pilus biogenesis protein PilO [Terriglobales bacterium]